MLPNKIRFSSVTTVVVFAWLAWSVGHPTSVGQEPGQAQSKGAKIKDLQKDWLETLRAMVTEEQARFKNAQAPPEEVITATRMLAEAELEACESDRDRVIALEKILATA